MANWKEKEVNGHQLEQIGYNRYKCSNGECNIGPNYATTVERKAKQVECPDN